MTCGACGRDIADEDRGVKVYDGADGVWDEWCNAPECLPEAEQAVMLLMRRSRL